MRTVAAILVVLSAHCAHLHAADDAKSFVKGLLPNIGREIKSDVNNAMSNVGDIASGVSNVTSDVAHKIIPDCFFGVRSVSMLLFTRDTPDGKKVEVDDMYDTIDPSKRVFFLVHGFISSANNTYNYQLASSLIKKDYTVFSLDWSDAACANSLPIANLLGYPTAVDNTREIGERLGSHIVSLMRNTNIPLKNITLIGHSLGAHVCGFAAKWITKLGHGTVSRLIAVDPAEPLFGLNKCQNRLCDSDADYVVALHTSPLGIPFSIGHLDLVFKNGYRQPGCFIDVPCSHSIGTLYLCEIMEHQNCVFPGVPISSNWVSNIGRLITREPSYPDSNTTNCIVINKKIFDSDYLTRGTYHIFVESKPNYCINRVFKCQ